MALDSRQDVGRAYGVDGIPHTVIIDAEGKIAWVTTGFRPGGAEEAANKVRELLGGQKPDEEENGEKKEAEAPSE